MTTVQVLTPYWDKDGKQKLKVVAQPAPKYVHGLIPPTLGDGHHEERTLYQLRSKDKDIEKYIFLSQLKLNDEDMFYKICLDHLIEITPLIYTPTVGTACLEFSHNYRRQEGIFISIKDKGKIGQILGLWKKKDEARISVVTDGSRILGLGDLGVNGMPICIGKLSLYVAGAGIRPSSTIPICLDFGTNNQKNLDDPLYLGLKQKRVGDDEMNPFMEEFMEEMAKTFPKLLIQFEDWTTEHAFAFLKLFRDRYPVFNDDIQGTGAVVLSGFMNAAKLSSAASGRPLREHRILFLGSGSAGVGVAMQVMSFFTLQGLSVEDAKAQIWLVDSQGLIYDERGPMPEHKKVFSRKDYKGPPLKTLIEVIDFVKPTALLGLSTIGGIFDETIIKRMATLNPRPIIFPLSNPVSLSECKFEDAVKHTDGKVIFASGSPFHEIEYNGKTLWPGQGNNMYIFPGLGLGAILSRSKHVTDSMVEASSLGLANSLKAQEHIDGLIYPRLTRVREVSSHIAVAVIRAAQQAGVDNAPALYRMSDSQLALWVESKMWQPKCI